ncbi:MAG: TetR/AcrR family transcriptional regulator [SAR324 cluster bacterium]|nr:TetR/AcrR family transcriptional regulator [SAR324 cluster bacterium]
MLLKDKPFKIESLLGFLSSWRVDITPFIDISIKNKILWGAARVFSEKGLNKTTVEDILSAANVSRRTFYQSFHNKEDVLSDIFNISAELIVVMIKTVTDSHNSIFHKLEAGINIFIDFLIVVGPLGNLLLSESMRPESPLSHQRVVLYSKIIEIIDNETWESQGFHLDPMVYQVLIFAVVGTAIHLYQETDIQEADIDRAKMALIAIMARASTMPGEELPPWPVKSIS